MRFLRKSLTVIAFWSLVGVSLAATVQVWRQGLPEGDIHWAVRRISDESFAQTPREERLRLAWRLEREFSRGVDLRPAVQNLSQPERARFDQNFNELTEAWLLEKVDTFFGLPDDRARSHYLDRQATRVKSWPLFTAALATSASADDEEKAQLERLASYLLSRSRELSLEERQKLQRFMFELALRSYQIHQFFPGLQLTF